MSPAEDQFRMSDNGLEPLASGGEKDGRRASPGTGFGDKKKVAIMIGLGVIALSVVAYQFLGGQGTAHGVVGVLDFFHERCNGFWCCFRLVHKLIRPVSLNQVKLKMNWLFLHQYWNEH
jgi:hypothetical protein